MTDSSSSTPVAIGVDYGTLSGRAVVVRVADGVELGSAVHEYPHAVLTDALPDTPAGPGAALPPDWALQVPADYVEVLRQAVPKALAAAGVSASDVIGIGTDFTACTVLPASFPTRSGSSSSSRRASCSRSCCFSPTAPSVPSRRRC